jgi:hypothetical protein
MPDTILFSVACFSFVLRETTLRAKFYEQVNKILMHKMLSSGVYKHVGSMHMYDSVLYNLMVLELSNSGN